MAEIESSGIAPLREQLGDELDAAQREAQAEQKLVEPTEDEKRNGWDAQSLMAYLAERHAGRELAVDVHSLHRKIARRASVQNHKYNPKRWRA